MADAAQIDGWFELARVEGVSGLLAERLLASGPLPAALRSSLMTELRGLAAVELAHRAVLVQVLSVLAAAKIRVLVLKGIALGEWLYPAPHLRESSDIDLLFATRDDALAAVSALASHGYRAPYMPGPFAHEILCRRVKQPVDLDLHWALACMPVLDALPTFDALWDDSMALAGIGPHARGLGKVDALLHACIHRASNLQTGLGDRLKWLYDMHLLANTADPDDWEVFVARCRRARVSGMALDALQATTRVFCTEIAPTVMSRLGDGMRDDDIDPARLGDWRYMQWKNLQALPGAGARWRWIGSQLLPPTGYLREVYGQRDAGRARLLWTRLGRLFARLGGRKEKAVRHDV